MRWISALVVLVAVGLQMRSVALAEEPPREEKKPPAKSARPARPARPARKVVRDTEGTEAHERFEAEISIPSHYKVDGKPLEVDPD